MPSNPYVAAGGNYPYTPDERNKLLKRVAPSNYSIAVDKLCELVEEHRFIPSETNGYKVARQE